MLNGLLGNHESALELMRRRIILAQKGLAEKSQPKLAIQKTSVDSRLQLKDFVLVHATDYPPYVDSTGVYLRSRFDGSQESETRVSIHFSLNHHVVSHKKGNWQERPYVLIASLEDVMALNGAPDSIRPEDTYWLLDPGMPVILPSSTILIYPQEKFVEIPLQTVTYASRRFLDEDLAGISAGWTTLFEGRDRMEQGRDWEMKRSFFSTHNLPAWILHGTPTLYGSLEEFVQARLRYSQDKLLRQPFPEITAREKIKTRFQIILGNLLRGRSVQSDEDSLDRLIWSQVPSVISPEILVHDYKDIRGDLSRNLGLINKLIAVERVIQQLGFRVRHVDPDYLADEDYGRDISKRPADVVEVLTFAEKVGFSTVRHPKTAEGTLDESLFHMKAAVLTEHSDICNPYENKKLLQIFQDDARAQFLVTSPQMRRMIYLLGAYQIADYYL